MCVCACFRELTDRIGFYLFGNYNYFRQFVIISLVVDYFVPPQADLCLPIAVHCLVAKAMGVALMRPCSWLQEASGPHLDHVHIWAG